MVEDLCFHIFDIVQNSVAAGASTVTVRVEKIDGAKDLSLAVIDDGKGMDQETVLRVQDPFYTTKGYKKVGLGIPLLKQTAQICEGSFDLRSKVGEGTAIEVHLKGDHIDCPPLGNLVDTALSLITGFEGVNVVFLFRTDKGELRLSTDEVRQQIGEELHMTHPDVLSFLRSYLSEGIGELL